MVPFERCSAVCKTQVLIDLHNNNHYNVLDVTSSQLDHVSCHATSTPAGDTAEAQAIARILNEDDKLIKKVSVTAAKSQLGHTFGAAGAIESIFTILSIMHVKLYGCLIFNCIFIEC